MPESEERFLLGVDTTSESNCWNGMLRLLWLDTASKDCLRLAFILSSLIILSESFLSNTTTSSDLGLCALLKARTLFLFYGLKFPGVPLLG